MTKERLQELNNMIISNKFDKDAYAQLDFTEAFSLFRLAALHREKLAADLKKLKEDPNAENKEEREEKLDKLCKVFVTKIDFFYSLAIEKVKAMECFYVAFSKCTNSPFVYCDPKTQDDLVWFFTTEEKIKEAVAKMAERHIDLRAIKVENKDFLKIFTSLFYMGIDNILFDFATENMAVALTRICRKPDFSKLENKAAQVVNVELQLSSMYFLQEARRNIEASKKQNLPVLEEEMSRNIVKGTFLVPIVKADPEGGLEPSNIRIPFLKGQNDTKVLPLFTDLSEFEKFNKDRKYSLLIIPFDKIESAMGPADAVGLNPLGTNIYMKKELLEKLKERF